MTTEEADELRRREVAALEKIAARPIPFDGIQWVWNPETATVMTIREFLTPQ